MRSPDAPWLTPHALKDIARLWHRERAAEPARWSARVAWYARQRSLRLTKDALARVSADVDVQVVHPLADPHFLAALASAGGRAGFPSRTAAMAALFADVLPADVVSRRTKAAMDEPFWNRHARSFIGTWRGDGVDQRLVDVEALRAEWAKERPDARTSSLLQAAWLATRSGR